MIHAWDIQPLNPPDPDAKTAGKDACLLEIQSQPQGAGIRINGNQLDDATPTQGYLDDPGKYTIDLNKDGYQAVRETIEVRKGITNKFVRALQKLPPATRTTRK